ncbi:MAG: hypothetical protein ABH882_00960 [Candidatus Omnitrophota bacterium]|nr:hypothetical protein [Candidatus Omnitrophota bacterium]MBU1929742.1 hypothetical protein [Candidatus Omnitrophota bacterium]MBU2035140.1 hypothetical protein [Candidatus Omnitrophota bacterium]MBU2258160.1 hypothetical protein [Candidatus Omnitrophota bacterium]
MILKRAISKAAPFIQGLPIFFIVFALVSTAGSQEVNKNETPPKGMEIRDLGSARVIVPKDMKLTEGKGIIIQEDLSEYVARAIANMQEDIAKVKSTQDELEKEIAEIKKDLEASKEENKNSKSKGE